MLLCGCIWLTILLHAVSFTFVVSLFLLFLNVVPSLRDKAQVEQLLRYIVEEVPEDSEKKRSFKYAFFCRSTKFCKIACWWTLPNFSYITQCRFPFIACEIFTCEIDIILRTLVEDEEVNMFPWPLLTYSSRVFYTPQADKLHSSWPSLPFLVLDAANGFAFLICKTWSST